MPRRARAVSFAFVVLSFAAALGAQACGGGATPGPATPGAPSSDPSGPAPSASTGASTTAAAPNGSGVSQEGGPCSDDVAVQKKCAPGLTCAPPPPDAPVSEHTPGVCKRAP